MVSGAAEPPLALPDAPAPAETPGWERLEQAARGAASALGEWRRRAVEAEHEVQRLRTELEKLTALGPLPSDEAGDELRRLRAENAVLTSRAAEARQRVSGLLARLSVLENRP
jgi:Sec-independent protein translocase protein TatA